MKALPRRLTLIEKKLTELSDACEPMSISQLDGYIAGIAVCPRLVLPSDWLSTIWGVGLGDDVFTSKKQAETLTRLVMEHYNEVLNNLGDALYTPVFFIDRRHDNVLWEMWSDGFRQAMDLRPESWAVYMNGDDRTAAALAGLITLCEISDGDTQLEKSKVEALQAAAPSLIPEWIQTLHDARIADQPLLTSPSIPIGSNKTGRNEPCSCGSGKKYKKCCGGILTMV